MRPLLSSGVADFSVPVRSGGSAAGAQGKRVQPSGTEPYLAGASGSSVPSREATCWESLSQCADILSRRKKPASFPQLWLPQYLDLESVGCCIASWSWLCGAHSRCSLPAWPSAALSPSTPASRLRVTGSGLRRRHSSRPKPG
jgi:hypothetical protein